MMQTFTLCPEEALKITEKPAPDAVHRGEPSARVLETILDFSRNLEVRPSGLVDHLIYVKS